jgi:hypothetical protein
MLPKLFKASPPTVPIRKPIILKAKPKKPSIVTEREQRERLLQLRKSFAGNAGTRTMVQTLIGTHFEQTPKKNKVDCDYTGGASMAGHVGVTPHI